MTRTIVPIGTELEIYPDADGNHDAAPQNVTPEDAFMSLDPGIYPGSYVESAIAVPSGRQTTVQINVLLIVTQDESFAVTTELGYGECIPMFVGA